MAYPVAVSDKVESGLRSQVRHLAYRSLSRHFGERPGCFVGQARDIHYRRGDDQAFVTPDLFVCFGVDSGALDVATSYLLWEAGAPPAFVLEIASEWTEGGEGRDKLAIYLEVGVEEYWRFNPVGIEPYTQMLLGGRHDGAAWEPIKVSPDDYGGYRGRSSVLGLDLHAHPLVLRFRDPHACRWLPDHGETR